ncbi:uncharacterized protein G2W53_028872 [Senna tora]|uniref:Uncharacterized protein n=1 Tax=Senna tora TaxID=362788 RepID=A0A834T475_9FABA|nr:uncharacterized protein G2W53_028872 [Senna tora]
MILPFVKTFYFNVGDLTNGRRYRRHGVDREMAKQGKESREDASQAMEHTELKDIKEKIVNTSRELLALQDHHEVNEVLLLCEKIECIKMVKNIAEEQLSSDVLERINLYKEVLGGEIKERELKDGLFSMDPHFPNEVTVYMAGPSGVADVTSV